MKRILSIRNIIAALAASGIALLGASCVNDPFEGGEQVVEGREVIVPVSFRMDYNGDEDPFTGNQSSTRAPLTGVDESGIYNVWILQFGGIDDDSPLVTRAQYIPDVTGTVSISLAQTAKASRIVAIANTGRADYPVTMDPGSITMGEFREIHTRAYGEQEIYREGYLPMSGYQDMPSGISSSSTIQIPLKRNMAKIALKLENLTGSDIIIDKIQLFSVPRIFEALAGISPRSGEIYPYSSLGAYIYTDYASEDISVGEGGSREFVWYVPRNQQGQTQSTNSREKNYYAPANATYVKMWGKRVSSGLPVIYTFYPGANMYNDYNLEPNKRYSLNVKMQASGDYMVDGRVENYELVDLSAKSSANSFILNPPPTDFNVRRVYRILPERVKEYWGVDGYDYTPAYDIGTSGNNPREWKIQIIWMDQKGYVARMPADPADMDPTKIYYHAPDNAAGADCPFEISIPPGVARGNFTIGLYTDVDDNGYRGENEPYLWSWHFWITDYNPDVQVEIIDTDKHFYKVPGGEVHRYDGSNWENSDGMYRNAVIMDRYMGVIHDDISIGTWDGKVYPLYYQYGRKDPFTLTGNYDENGSSVQRYKSGSVSIQEAISTPYICFNPSVFSTEMEQVAPFKLWMDPKLVGTEAEMINDPRKSIFDPCPYGWQIPTKSVWTGVSMTDELTSLNVLYPSTGRMSVSSYGSLQITNSNYRHVFSSTRRSYGGRHYSWIYRDDSDYTYPSTVRCVKLSQN